MSNGNERMNRMMRALPYSITPVLVDNNEWPNSTTICQICINNISPAEKTFIEMIMYICKEFNIYSVYEDFPDEQQYDLNDYIAQIIIPSQRTSEDFDGTLLGLYIERAEDSLEEYNVRFVTGVLDDDDSPNVVNFTFENRFQALINIRQILNTDYLPFAFSSAALRQYQSLLERISIYIRSRSGTRSRTRRVINYSRQ